MKKTIVILVFLMMVSVLYAQVLWVESDNISVAGAVMAEVMKEIREFFKISDSLSGSLVSYYSPGVMRVGPVQFSYGIRYDLDYSRFFMLEDILRTKRYWVENLQLSIDTYNNINVRYTFNGTVYPVIIKLFWPG